MQESKPLKPQQTKINFYTNIATLIATIIVGVYYTPFLIHQLGLAAYGIVPLALIVNQYINVVTGSLTGAFTRFYSVSIQQNKYEEASKDISTSFFVILIIIGLLLPLLSIFVWQIETIFNIPIQYVKSAKLLFIFTISSFFFSLLSSLFNVTLYALNRLDLMNYLKIIRNVLKLSITTFLFNYIAIDIQYIGVANCVTEIIILLISIILYFKHKPLGILISFSKFSKPIIYSIWGMTIWTIIQQIGDTLLYRTDNIIVNKFYGIEFSGALGSVSEFGSYILIVVSTIGSLFGPLILIAYSKRDHNEVKTLSIDQSYMVGALSAIIAGVISGYGNIVLKTWLGYAFIQYSDWLTIKLIVIPFYAAGGILAFVYRSWNKVKFPALATLFLGLLNATSLILIIHIFDRSNNIIILLSICALFSIIQSYIIGIVCFNKIYKGMVMSFMFAGLKILLIFIVSYVISRFVEKSLNINSLFELGITLSITMFLILIFVYLFAFSKENRMQLISLIK